MSFIFVKGDFLRSSFSPLDHYSNHCQNKRLCYEAVTMIFVNLKKITDYKDIHDDKKHKHEDCFFGRFDFVLKDIFQTEVNKKRKTKDDIQSPTIND